MCRAVTCRKCGKTTWAGCGAHVEQVLGHVPLEERCRCASAPASTSSTPSTKWWQRLAKR